MSNYITEAFKQLNLLESEDISLGASGITELRSFLDDAAVDPDEEMMDIYDLKAEAEEDLAKSYEGKVVLECTVCHSHIFEDKENISMDEEGEACKDIECPYCMSNEGYFILGEIAPFNQEEADSFKEEETEEEVDLPDVDIEDAAEEVEEDDLEESLTENMKLDGVEELYDNDEIRGVEELEGSDKMEGSDAIRGDKHKAPINESILPSGFNFADNSDVLLFNGKPVGSIWDDSTIELDNPELFSSKQIKSLAKWSKRNYGSGMVVDNDENTIYDIDESLSESCDKRLKESIDSDDIDRVWGILEDAGIEINDVDEDYIDCCSDEDAEAACDILNDAGFSCYVEENEDEYRPNSVMFESLKGLKESYKKHCNESIEDVSVTTEDETMTMTTKDDGGVVIETIPKDEEIGVESEEEMIVPISDESSEVIDAATDALDTDDEEDFEEIKADMENSENEIGEEGFEDFDEESFNGLGESYLRNCYENVKSFKTTGVSSKNNKLFIEGVIKFDSGNIKETQFVFESLGNGKFEGYNKQISRGKKTYKLSGSVKNNKLVCESLNYNYRSKNELNESVRVYGTVKRK